MIVCLEGIDASGKSTQAGRMAERLNARLIHFPDYDTPSGRLIRRHLQNERQGGDHLYQAFVLQSLMLTNRMEKASFINSYLLGGGALVLDRYWPSGLVYGAADGLDYQWLVEIHQHLPQAHHYILLDTVPDLSAERRPERRDRYEKQAGLMEDVARRYRDVWVGMQKTHGSEWHVVDGHGTVEEVEAEIWHWMKTAK
jgi:dTMP kinase